MKRLRVVFYLGKGGVGKTVLSLATAVRSAELGHKTLVVSTDIAHNLADFLDQPVSYKPTQIADNLWAQEINAFADIQDLWGSAQDEISQNMRDSRFGDVVAEEVATFPGLDEFGNLSNLIQEIKAGDFERIIVDTAATGSTIRMLSMPDSFRWYADYLQKLADNRLVKVALPLANMFVKKPAQIQAAFNEKEAEVAFLQTILRDADISSYRVVIQPERVAVREAERIINFLSLYDFPIDGLIMNRVLNGSVEQDSDNGRRIREATYLEQWAQDSQPYMMWTVSDCVEEIVGLEALSRLAEACFGPQDPGAIYTRGPSQQVVVDPEGHYLLRFPMPFLDVGDVHLRQKGNELFILMGNFKRELTLPAVLDGQRAKRAVRADGMMTIVFEQGKNS